MSTRALRTAASGLYARQVNIEVISNNVANVNTTGFKKNKAEFQDLMYQEVVVNSMNVDKPGVEGSGSVTIEVGNGVQTSSIQKIFKQGDMTATYNKLDIAIHGEGFFQLRKSDGTFVYTRDGSFKTDAYGRLVTSTGYIVEPELIVNENVLGIMISRDGTIEIQETGGGISVLGNIELVRFINPGGLKALGDNLYAETPNSGAPILGSPAADGFGEIHQGFLEPQMLILLKK